MKDIVVIGAGLTGLTLSFLLKRQGKDILLLEKMSRVGGVIHTHHEQGYIFEEGPNTGVVSNPEVVELFEMLGCEIETANESAEKRLILKNSKWYPLPCGIASFMTTPLFSPLDKFGILFEPFRKKGADPEESVASLASRRIGQSFVDYAVNPFISGIYAGDPERLVTKYALPKLYNLEQNYGSFIGGALKKCREKKTEREKKATKKVFSVKGGLETLIDFLSAGVEKENIVLRAENVTVLSKNNYYEVHYLIDGLEYIVEAKKVVTTSGAFTLPQMLPFVLQADMNAISELNYAKIIQVSVALEKGSLSSKYISFGGLIPSKENRQLLGVLFPSYCFIDRAPEGCSMLAVYMGGIKRPELFSFSDEEITKLVNSELKSLFDISEDSIVLMKIFRHEHAIPQYEKSSGDRFDAIDKIHSENEGLIIAGNLRNGIGMADRIKQAFDIAEQLK